MDGRNGTKWQEGKGGKEETSEDEMKKKRRAEREVNTRQADEQSPSVDFYVMRPSVLDFFQPSGSGCRRDIGCMIASV